MPEAGGPYDYVARSLGAPPAFLVMWSYWISTWVTNAAISIAAVSYLSTLAPGSSRVPAVAALVAIAFVALFTAIACTRRACLGRRPDCHQRAQGHAADRRDGHRADRPRRRRPARAQFAPAPVSADGIAGSRSADPVGDARLRMRGRSRGASSRIPTRTIPRATLIGTLVVGLIYLAASSAVFLLLPADIAAESQRAVCRPGRPASGAGGSAARGRLRRHLLPRRAQRLGVARRAKCR